MGTYCFSRSSEELCGMEINNRPNEIKQIYFTENLTAVGPKKRWGNPQRRKKNLGIGVMMNVWVCLEITFGHPLQAADGLNQRMPNRCVSRMTGVFARCEEVR